MFSHKFGAGDHGVILVDFKLEDNTGEEITICRPSMRCLAYENKQALQYYKMKVLELVEF